MERDQTNKGINTNTVDFNSHAHVERDLQSDTFHNDLVVDFNSHAHVERDFRPHFCAKMIQYFNSHAHVERDT